MWCARDDRKKEHTLFCVMKVTQTTLPGKTVTFDKALWNRRLPFYTMATVLTFQGNSGYDLAKL